MHECLLESLPERRCGSAQVHSNLERVPSLITQVYKELSRHLEDIDLAEQQHLRALGAEACIWTGKVFAHPESVVFQDHLAFEPALHSLDRRLAASFKPLLLLLGVSALWAFYIHLLNLFEGFQM